MSDTSNSELEKCKETAQSKLKVKAKAHMVCICVIFHLNEITFQNPIGLKKN